MWVLQTQGRNIGLRGFSLVSGKSVSLQRTSCTVTKLVLFIPVYPEFFSFLLIMNKLRTKPGSFLFQDRSCEEQPQARYEEKTGVAPLAAPLAACSRGSCLALAEKSWLEAQRQWDESGTRLLLPEGLPGQSLPPYLSSGLCCNRSLPHRSHAGHEKAVSSSTAVTVPGPGEAKGAPQDGEDNTVPQTVFSLVSLHKCS